MNRSGIFFKAAVVYILLQLALGINAATSVALIKACNIPIGQISIIFSAYSISLLLFNIPAGIFADIFGRRNSTIIGLLILGTTYLLLVFANSFEMFFLANFMGGLGTSFVTCAYDALVVDKMHNFEANAEKRIFAHITRYSQIGRMFGTLLGGYLGFIYTRLPWLTTSLILYLLFFWIWFYIEKDVKKLEIETKFHNVMNHLKERVILLKNYYKDNPYTKIVNISGVLNAVAFYLIFLVFQPYFMKLSGKPIWILGYVGVLYSLSMVIATVFLDKFAHIKYMAVYFMCAAAAVLMIIPFVSFYLALLLYMIFAFSYSIFNSSRLGLLTSYTENHKEQRATLYSVDIMLSELFVAIVYIISPKIGLVPEGSSMWFAAAVVLIPSLMLYRFAENKLSSGSKIAAE